MDSVESTLAEIRSKAAELRSSFGDEERARARPADGSPPLRQVAALRGEEGQAAEARRWALAPVSPEVGDRAEASLPQGRRRGWRLEDRGSAGDVVPASRRRD